MLHFIRERAQGWVAWFIVGLISIPFALWGVNSYIGGASQTVLAEVNGEPIYESQYLNRLQQYRNRLREQLGEQFDPEMLERQEVKQQLLEQLIEQKLLAQTSAQIGQYIDERTISQHIYETKAFQVDGQFDSAQYKSLLARAGLSPASYEQQLRYDLLNRELTSAIESSTIVSVSEAEHLIQLEQQKRDAAIGKISYQTFLDDNAVSDSEMKTYYENNMARFMLPAQVDIEYISLSVSSIAEKLTPTEEVLRAFYEDNLGQFMRPEQRKVSHILIESDKEAAIKILTAVKHRLDQGEQFATIAEELSQDTGSAGQGGDLGYIQKGVMEDDNFDKALFSLMEVGQVSEIVETSYGYHLLKLTDIQAVEQKSLLSVREEVSRRYQQQEAEKIFFEQAEVLAELSYEYPDTLTVAADALDIPIQSTGFFSKSQTEIAGIAANKKVNAAAFSDEVLNERLNSAVIELSDQAVVVIRHKAYQPAKQSMLAEVEQEIRSELSLQYAKQRVKEEGETILQKIQQGGDPALLLSQYEWHTQQTLSRREQQFSYEILEQLYRMQKPLQSPNYHGFIDDEGNYIILVLYSVITPEKQKLTEADRAELLPYLEQNQGRSELAAFINSLKESADIAIIQP